MAPASLVIRPAVPTLSAMPEIERPARHGLLTLFTILVAFGVYLAGNDAVPLWDRDEPRYAQCSRQMLDSGDWVLPRYLGELRMAKPPLIYWLQATSMSVLGVNEFAARLPSAVGMALTLLLIAHVVRRRMGDAHAFWTVLILATSIMTIVSAKACLTDAVLLLFITIAQLCVYQMWMGRGTWLATATLGLTIGLALLTKGPVVLGVSGMTLVGLALLKWTLRWRRAPLDLNAPRGFPITPGAERSDGPDPQGIGLRERDNQEGGSENVPDVTSSPAPAPPSGPSIMRIAAKALVACALVFAVCLPWYLMVEKRWEALPAAERERAASRGGARRTADVNTSGGTAHKGYVQTVIDREVLDRSARGHEGHWGPPGYYLASIWPTFLPWSLILPLTLVLAWRRRAEPHVRFALAAVLGPWLMFEIVQTKLPHYLLPCFPPLAFLAADAVVYCLRGRDDALVSTPFVRGAIVWGVILSLLGAAPWLAMRFVGSVPVALTIVASLLAVAYAGTVVVLFLRRRPAAALGTAGWGMFAVIGFLFAFYLPSLEFLRIAPRTAALLRERGATGAGMVAMLDYKEPSLAFYQGGTIRENSNTIVTPKLLETSPPWLVITREVWDRSPEASRARLEVAGTFRGLDVADGMRVVEVMVVRKKD